MKNLKKVVAVIAAILLAAAPGSANAQDVKYQGFLDSGCSVGEGSIGFDQWITSTTHGVSLLSNKLFVGAGIGFGLGMAIDDGNGKGRYTLPVYGACRYTFRDMKIQPFISAKVGYSELLGKSFEGSGSGYGGFYFAPAVGVTLPTDDLDFNITLGYSIKRASYSSHVDEPNYTEVHRTHFNAGGFFVTAGIAW